MRSRLLPESIYDLIVCSFVFCCVCFGAEGGVVDDSLWIFIYSLFCFHECNDLNQFACSFNQLPAMHSKVSAEVVKIMMLTIIMVITKIVYLRTPKSLREHAAFHRLFWINQNKRCSCKKWYIITYFQRQTIISIYRLIFWTSIRNSLRHFFNLDIKFG